MRELRNDTQESVEISVYNCYGVQVRSVTLEPQNHTRIEKSGSFRAFVDCDREVFIYDGEGVLELSATFTPYNFSHIDNHSLQAYLLHDTLPKRYAQEYADFKRVSEWNLQKGFDNITPTRYSELWEWILAQKEQKERVCRLQKL